MAWFQLAILFLILGITTIRLNTQANTINALRKRIRILEEFRMLTLGYQKDKYDADQ